MGRELLAVLLLGHCAGVCALAGYEHGWPNRTGYEFIGMGYCRDDLMRSMRSYLTSSLTPTNTRAEAAAECWELCDTAFASNISKCMGVAIQMPTTCTLFDRDWLESDKDELQDVLGTTVGGNLIQDFAGTHITRGPTIRTERQASYNEPTGCYRRLPNCSQAPDCTALNRYPCEYGKVDGTCDTCRPRFAVAGGNEPGNDVCNPDGLPRPVLRVALPGSQRQVDPHYQAGLLGNLYSLKHAWENNWAEMPVPLDERQDFTIEFVSFSDNWTKVAPNNDVFPGTGEVVAGDIQPQFAAMSGATNTSMHQEWALRETSPPGQPVHAIMGGEATIEQEKQLASVAAAYKVPMFGWRWQDVSLTSLPWYIRTNRVALDPGTAIGALFRYLGYFRIFVVQQSSTPRIEAQIMDMMNSAASIIKEGPSSICLGEVRASDAFCIYQVMDAWDRVRNMDARIIAHEMGGAQIEYLLALGTNLLNEMTLYVQAGRQCDMIWFLYYIAEAQSYQEGLLETFYFKSRDHNETDGRCQICLNIAMYRLNDEQRRNRTAVAHWLFSPDNSIASYHDYFCPHLDTVEKVLAGNYDTRADEFASPECSDLNHKFTAAFARSGCVEAFITYDMTRMAKFGDYRGTLNPEPVDPSTAMDYIDDSNMTEEEALEALAAWKRALPIEEGLNATAVLRDIGYPISFLEQYEPGGYMWELGMSSALAQPVSWRHANDDTQLLAGISTGGSQIFGNYGLPQMTEAFLTILVAFNTFVKNGGDADPESSVGRKHIENNYIAWSFIDFVKDSKFLGVEGPVEYQSNGERNILYKLGQLRAPQPEGCWMYAAKGTANEMSAVAVPAQWNFVSGIPDATNISGELIVDTSNLEGCYPFSVDMTGKIAMVWRGTCYFATKTLMTQAAGAVAVLISNHPGLNPTLMEGKDAELKIPTFMITRDTFWAAHSLMTVAPVSAVIPYSRCVDVLFPVTHGLYLYEDTMFYNPATQDLTVPGGDIIFTGGSTTPPLQGPLPCGVGAWYSVETRSCHICQPGTYMDVGAPAGTPCQDCPAGRVSNATRSLSCDECGVGMYSPLGAEECLPCPIGTISRIRGAGACAACKKGERWVLRSGGPRCLLCHKGSFQNETGQTECIDCPLGTFAVDEGKSDGCQECGIGAFQSNKGSSTCEQCDETTYQEEMGQDSCLPCIAVIPGSVAPGRGTFNRSHCECAEGTFRQRANEDDSVGACVACLDGLICPGGMTESGECCEPPKQAARVHAGVPEFDGGPIPYRVYCYNSKKCPAGRELGECIDHATGRGCDVCEPGTVWVNALAECVYCSDTPLWQLALFFTGAAIVLPLGMGIYAIRGVTVQSETKMTIAFTFTLSINVLQVLAAFRELTLEWAEPMLSIYNTVQIMTFRTDFLKPGCALKGNDAVSAYLFTLLVHPTFAICLSLVCAVIIWGPKPFRRPLSAAQVANSQGLAVLIMYVSISLVAVLPWQCERNLDGSSSILSYPSVACWEGGKHTKMLIFSVFGILVYDVGFIAMIAWIIYRYSANITKPGGVQFIRYYRFLFNRFSSKHYYYVLPFCLRNLSLALLPVIFVNAMIVQVLCISLLIAGSALLQCWIRPWRTAPANVLDACASLGLMMVLNGGMMLADIDKTSGLSMVRIFFHVVVFSVVFAFVVVLFRSLYYFVNPPKTFGIFLSHHKQGAQVLARWFKLQMTDWTHEKIFLDSDNLSALSSLFEICSHRTKNLMVILTRETLRSAICAGEIASASRHNVNIVLVACGDYVPPNEMFLEYLADEWSDHEKALMVNQGVELAHVKEAYGALPKLATIELNRELPIQKQKEVMRAAFDACQGMRAQGLLAAWSGAPAQQKSSAPQTETGLKQKQSLVVLGNNMNPEDAAQAAVIAMLLHIKTGEEVGVLSGMTPEEMESALTTASHVLLVLTRGTLENPRVAGATGMAHKKRFDVVCIVADRAFEFPNASWIATLQAGKVVSKEEARQNGVSLGRIVKAYKSVFEGVSLRFSPQSSDLLQNAEVEEMVSRFKMSRLSHKMTKALCDSEQSNEPVALGTGGEVQENDSSSEEEAPNNVITDELV